MYTHNMQQMLLHIPLGTLDKGTPYTFITRTHKSWVQTQPWVGDLCIKYHTFLPLPPVKQTNLCICTIKLNFIQQDVMWGIQLKLIEITWPFSGITIQATHV